MDYNALWVGEKVFTRHSGRVESKVFLGCDRTSRKLLEAENSWDRDQWQFCEVLVLQIYPTENVRLLYDVTQLMEVCHLQIFRGVRTTQNFRHNQMGKTM